LIRYCTARSIHIKSSTSPSEPSRQYNSSSSQHRQYYSNPPQPRRYQSAKTGGPSDHLLDRSHRSSMISDLLPFKGLDGQRPSLLFPTKEKPPRYYDKNANATSSTKRSYGYFVGPPSYLRVKRYLDREPQGYYKAPLQINSNLITFKLVYRESLLIHFCITFCSAAYTGIAKFFSSFKYVESSIPFSVCFC
jgi:hypothetical protein